MRRLSLVIGVSLIISASLAYGQENAGAGRFEISALPAGAVLFTSSDNGAEPEFGNYVLGGSFTYNFNRWIGFEAEAGSLVGVHQTLDFNSYTLSDQHTPDMFAYTGNVAVSPWGSSRRFVPFVTGGLGGLTMFDSQEVANLGITSSTTFLTGNVGGGAKWFANRTWGVRGDYRFMMVDGKASAPAFFGQSSRYGHRVTGGLVLTY